MKTEVYSWRLSKNLKSELEREARLRKVRVASLLEVAVREWLAKSAMNVANDETQKKLHASIAKCVGLFASGNPRGSETVREAVRKRLAGQYGR
jgi:hypothetical protein